MERIREAVSKARDARSRAEAPASRSAPPSSGRVHSPASRLDESFLQAACDFEGFGAHRIISNEQDPVLNAYRVLRTRVLQRMEERNWRTLAVVSPGAGAGKTVTAINLAIAIAAMESTRVTLVDLDFYRPRVAKYLGISAPPSILDYFEGKKTLADVTVKPDLPDLLLIANERVTRRGAQHLTSTRMDDLIETATRTYDSKVVIFDMSPVLGCDDTIAFLPKVDCALVVASSGETRIRDLRETQRILGPDKILGSVLNKAPNMLPSETFYY